VKTADRPDVAAPAVERPAPDVRTIALRRFAISITVFNVVGHLFLGFEQSWAQPVVALIVAYTLEVGFEALNSMCTSRTPRFVGGSGDFVNFLLPAHITGLAIAMLIYPNSELGVIAFAVSVAIGSKWVFRIRINGAPRHFLNPSNFGIVVTLLLWPWVSIAPPYHFTENLAGPLDWILPLAILISGLMLNVKLTRRGPLIAGWIGGFAGQAVARAAIFGTPVVAGLTPMTGVAFVLFSNYMVTDPSTTPTRARPQFVFGIATAATYGALVALHIVFGLFFSLVIVCVTRGALIEVANLRVALARSRSGHMRSRSGALAPEPAIPAPVAAGAGIPSASP
jgi:hypothetical protein